jgi:hypothetical protein
VVTTAVNVLQVLLFVVTAWIFVQRARVVLFTASLDRKAFVPALRAALGAGQLELGRSLANACLPAWPARIAVRGIEALESRSDLGAALEEQRIELSHMAPTGIAALRSLARMAPPLAFIGIISELGRALSGDYGLAALQRGLPARMALERGLLTFALGVVTTLVAVAAARVLIRAVNELARGAAEVTAALQSTTAAAPDPVAPSTRDADRALM